jgi:2-oxoacid:acceptor oxidoreductase delta subunit (pyruvate/2-ketoisovalerate family)
MNVKPQNHTTRDETFSSWRDLPPLNISQGDMLHNKTGTWRFIKPIHEDKTPACQNGCPAGNDIEAWIKLIEQGDYQAAYWHLKREQPFPAILGRVCFKFCQEQCNRSGFDHHVRINSLERFVGDQVPASSPHPDLPLPNGKTLAIIGSGPAGMSCAYFARLLGFEVTIFDKLHEPGGILRVGIPRFRLPREIVAREFEGLINMGIELRTGIELGKDISIMALMNEFDFIFLSTGAHDSMKLELAVEGKTNHIISGLDFLQLVAFGREVNLGRHVAVIGGGNTAMDVARTAVRLGAEVTVIYRRTQNEMSAHAEEIMEAIEEGVKFRFLATPEQVILAGNGGIQKIICRAMELCEKDKSGRKRPVKTEGRPFELPADTIVSAIGEKPDLKYMEEIMNLERGTIPVTTAMQIMNPVGESRLYAGGDIIDMPHTVIHAVASGKRAAIALDCNVKGKDFNDIRQRISIGHGSGLSFSTYMGWRNPNSKRRDARSVVEAVDMVFDYFRKTPSVPRSPLDAKTRREKFTPIQTTFSKEQARRESERCMHCGRCTECDNCLVFCPDMSVRIRGNGDFGYTIEYDYCKGCGICAAECPRHAITMINEEMPVGLKEA